MTPSIASTTTAARALPRARILVVDDTQDNLFLMTAVLEGDYEVCVAHSGAAALAAASSGEPPDLILLDVMMPQMDGYEVMRRLRANPAARHIPVIFLTGLAGSEEEQYGLDLGAAGYLHKPVSPPQVLALVKLQLERAASARRLHALSQELTRHLAPHDSQPMRLDQALQPASCAMARQLH